jgi:sugar/nucleoside kinase (ribokinase family)
MAKRIASVGDLVVDLVLDVAFPIEIDHHQMSPALLLEPGGAGTVVLAARRMGLDVSVLGAVGADFQGRMIKEVLDLEGVDTSVLLMTPGSTTTTVIALADQQRRGHVFLGHYGEGEPVTLTSAALDVLKQVDAVFMPGYTLVEERLKPLVAATLAFLAGNQTPFYLDVGPFLGQVAPQAVEDVLAVTDVLLLTEEEIPYVTAGQTSVMACQQLIERYPQMLIVLKSGAKGCQIFSGASTVVCEGYPVQVVDTIGAGDSFAGAFMWAHLQGLPLGECGKIANAMGAASVCKAGGGRNVPDLSEVQNILDRYHTGLQLPC